MKFKTLESLGKSGTSEALGPADKHEVITEEKARSRKCPRCTHTSRTRCKCLSNCSVNVSQASAERKPLRRALRTRDPLRLQSRHCHSHSGRRRERGTLWACGPGIVTRTVAARGAFPATFRRLTGSTCAVSGRAVPVLSLRHAPSTRDPLRLQSRHCQSGGRRARGTLCACGPGTVTPAGVEHAGLAVLAVPALSGRTANLRKQRSVGASLYDQYEPFAERIGGSVVQDVNSAAQLRFVYFRQACERMPFPDIRV